jgi:hypothetical protein
MLDITVDHLIKMINFLEKETFVIDFHGLKLPKQADGIFWKAERIFKFKKNGRISYKGWGYPDNGHTFIENDDIDISDNQQWIGRTFLDLLEDIKSELYLLTRGSGMKNAYRLLLKFNGLDFLRKVIEDEDDEI